MKTFTRLFTITLLTINLITINFSFAQNGDPPPPPAEHGENGNQVPGGGAPVGSGLLIMLSLSTAYGGKKLWDYQKRDLPE
ncbi:MAG: hypothetical protein K9H16_07210 [Bacteroidales bacterium]|nr:hypothetical protein [Bacteroidales bacterium]